MEFAFEFDRRFAPWLRLLTGATAQNSSVVLAADDLQVRFGRMGTTTPLGNIVDVKVTRDYRWFKAIGARLSLADRGATYGSTTRAGVCLCFHEPVSALPFVASPGLTVTVADPEGLATAVRTACGLG